MSARVVRALAVAGFAIVWTLGALLVTLRQTVLDADWYVAGFEAEDAFERVYREVLADPRLNDLVDDLTAGLPLDASVVTANVRLVVPPSTLRAVVHASFSELTAYLRGERDLLDVEVPLDPLFERVEQVADAVIANVVASAPPVEVRSLGELAGSVQRLAGQLASGAVPDLLPTVPLGPELAPVAADVVLQPLPPAARRALRAAVVAELAAGRLDGALALVAPAYAEQHIDRRIAAFAAEVGRDLDVERAFAPLEGSPLFRVLDVLRWTYGTAYWSIVAVLVAAAGACLAVVWATTRRLGGRAGHALALTAMAGAAGALAASLAVVLALAAADPFLPLVGDRSPVPKGAARVLVADVAGALVDDFGATLADRAWYPAAAGAVALLMLALLVRVDPGVARPGRRGAAWVGLGVGALVLVGPVSYDLTRAEIGPPACNGAPELCDRPYDEVVFAGTHNAMASSDAGFLGAVHDPTIIGQLDAGYRALFVDSHTWHRPQHVQAFLSSLPRETAAALRALIDPESRREGTWLCHQLCQLGATRFVDALRALGAWSATHPTEVITLVVEDHITVHDTVRAFEESGILDRVATPPEDPDDGWPTLGEMIDSGRTIVVFSERVRTGPPWYPNLFDHAMETPFTFTDPARMGCEANRGGEGKRLFLVNHWITRTAASRADAAVVNERAAVVTRGRRCANERDELPTWIAVDWSTIGDVPGAVRMLNGLEPA